MLTLLIAGPVSAQTLVVLSGESPVYESYMGGLRAELASTGRKEALVVRQESELGSGQRVEGYSAVVAVGTGAARKVRTLEVGETRVLYTLMPSATYRFLVADETKSTHKNTSVLFLDQPLKRYLSLIHKIFKRQDVVVGLLYSSDAEAQYERLREQAKGYKIKAFKVAESGEIITTLQHKMSDADVLLALPDARLFNSQSVQAVLLTTFRIKLPIVAFSDGFAQAGAIAALVSKPEDVGRQTAEMLVCQLSECVANEAWPKYFSVSVNKTVARRLGIEIEDPGKLVDQIKSMERTGAHE